MLSGLPLLSRGAGADFIKIGIGGGSVSASLVSRRVIGRGQATSVIDAACASDEYF